MIGHHHLLDKKTRSLSSTHASSFALSVAMPRHGRVGASMQDKHASVHVSRQKKQKQDTLHVTHLDRVSHHVDPLHQFVQALVPKPHILGHHLDAALLSCRCMGGQRDPWRLQEA